MIGIRLDSPFERLLGLRNLARIPQDHALIEESIGVAAAATGGPGRASPEVGGLLARLCGLIELSLGVVDGGEATVRRRVVGLELDRLLVGGFRLVPFL